MLVKLVSNSWPQVIPLASASQSAGIIGISHCNWPKYLISTFLSLEIFKYGQILFFLMLGDFQGWPPVTLKIALSSFRGRWCSGIVAVKYKVTPTFPLTFILNLEMVSTESWEKRLRSVFNERRMITRVFQNVRACQQATSSLSVSTPCYFSKNGRQISALQFL